MPQSTHCDCVGFWIIRCEADSSPQGERQRGIRILAVRKCQTQTSVRPAVARPSSILIKSLQGKNGFNPKIFVPTRRKQNPFDDQQSPDVAPARPHLSRLQPFCHGASRIMSRMYSKKNLGKTDLVTLSRIKRGGPLSFELLTTYRTTD